MCDHDGLGRLSDYRSLLERLGKKHTAFIRDVTTGALLARNHPEDLTIR